MRADLLLDTPVYNAHTSAGDALWAAVPIITLDSPTQWPNMASRVCASMLRTVGITETIVHSFEEYEELAVHLATHPHELKALKERLLRTVNDSPLFDTVQVRSKIISFFFIEEESCFCLLFFITHLAFLFFFRSM
jgi:predicted O-linked N-acetylglucosamine transferase (SPINDLY family)